MTKTELKQIEIGNHIELIYGDGLPERERKGGKYPVYGSNGIVGHHDQALVKGPGIIIGRKGTVGQVTLSKDDFWPIDTTYYVKLKEDGDIFFWFYLLQTLGLSQMNSHSAVPGLNRDNVYSILKEIPPPVEQRAIAKVLSVLDEKIELNHQMNKTLETIGQALFERWFVDFESTGSFDWQVDELGRYIQFIKGKKPPQILETQLAGYRPQILIDNLNGNPSLYANENGMITVEIDEPIMVMDGASSGRVEIGHSGILGSTLAKVIVTSDRLSNLFLYYFLKDKEPDINQNTTGTSIPHTDKEKIKRYQCNLPPKDLLENFNEIAGRIINKVTTNKRETEFLIQIRDSLLPRLMSGKIRVQEALGHGKQ